MANAEEDAALPLNALNGSIYERSKFIPMISTITTAIRIAFRKMRKYLANPLFKVYFFLFILPANSCAAPNGHR